MFCQVWICGLKNKTKKVGPLELGKGGKMDGWGGDRERARPQRVKKWKDQM